MGQYIDQNLSANEIVKYEAKVSTWGQFPLILAGFLFIWLGGIGIIFWIIAFLNWWSTELAITDRKIIAKYGFISRKTIELRLDKVETVSVDQGVFGRMFNYGTISVAGAGHPVPIKGISDPILFRKRYFEVTEGE